MNRTIGFTKSNIGSKKYGTTLIELIIAMAVTAIVLGLVGGYLAQTSDSTRRDQATSEVQDRVRMAMQVMVQDLNQVGSSRYSTSDNNNTALLEATCPIEECLYSTTTWDGYKYLQVKYVSSLSASSSVACHQVRYRLSLGDNLRRMDVADDNCETGLTSWSGDYLARNILDMDIQFYCSNGRIVGSYPNVECPADGTAYPRSAMLTIVGRSENKVEGTASKKYTTVKGRTVTCPEDYVCYALSQEVQMPNLKDR